MKCEGVTEGVSDRSEVDGRHLPEKLSAPNHIGFMADAVEIGFAIQAAARELAGAYGRKKARLFCRARSPS